MKRCPTCQKTFDDSKRFCQVDGTSLVDDAPEKDEPVDLYKTVVGGQFNPPPSNAPAEDSMKTMVVDSKSKDEDILQIPEVFDPMKTVVVSDPIKKETPPEPVKEPEPPKFNEPSLSPPSFGDLSSSPKEVSKVEEAPKSAEPPKFESPFGAAASEPPKSDSPFSSPVNDAPKFGSPFSSASNEPPKFESPFAKESEEKPKNDSLPPFKEHTAPLGEKKDPFHNSAFGLPQIPLEQSYTPPTPAFNPSPAASQQNDWAPPPAPVASWENQEIGANTPFNPPVAGGEGENKTMAIISLVCGILSCLCCVSVLTGPAGIILGYMAKGNIDKNPAVYGGRGLAMGGMITGAIGTLIGIAAIVLQVFFGVLGGLSR